MVFKLFLLPPPSTPDQNASPPPPLPTNARTTVILKVIRIGWFFDHKQFEEFKKQFYKTKMVNIHFSITNTLNWTWNKLSNWTRKPRGKRWPGENCSLRREFWIQTWHVRLVAATGGRLIKSPPFLGLSTNTNVTFYCNCSNAPFTISTPPSDCLLASARLKVHMLPLGERYRPLWKPLKKSLPSLHCIFCRDMLFNFNVKWDYCKLNFEYRR